MPVTMPPLSDPAYRIEAELGEGGGGVVYKAWHTRLQKYVVIKELKSGSAHDIETQRNEVEALKNVKSAYLPQVLDFITENGHIYTVMEFVEGESLDKWLDRGHKFSQPQVVKWYGQLVSALEVIHKHDICHRDVKPANIMLTPNGDVCLIDFNAALVSGNDVRMISRSLGYASPEQYEIYERYKNARSASPINLGSSSVNVNPVSDATEYVDGDKTAYVDGDKTEYVDGDKTAYVDGDKTTYVDDAADPEKTEAISPSHITEIDWKRSDVYSLGATMYHMLSGRYPPPRAAEVVPVSKLGAFGEGIVYIIEKSMQLNPANRFASASVLGEAVRHIRDHDTRWRVSQSKKIAAAVILPIAFALFAGTTLFGSHVMAQEKEERYYAYLYDIETGGDPHAAYDAALDMFWDRIDPYRAMAERLWDDGDIEACRDYIVANLGNIAEFQAVPASAHSFGDIYFILGNCYYNQPGEPDYVMARGSFEIATAYVKDNPIYYRDYAIALARTGQVAEAERVLEKAQVLNLDQDSLFLLHGEIAYAKQNNDEAVDYFDKVIAATDDDYVRYRAFHATDEIFKMTGQPERSVLLLESAVNRIPLNRVPEMTERLADAYVKTGDYDQAIRLFTQLAESGTPRFHIMEGLAILYHNSGDLAQAATVLAEMAELFPNDYRVPMRQAYLEADAQYKIENESRDYTATKQYYDAAKTLYDANVKPGEADPEMQQLDYLIEQLRANKWID